MAVARTTTPATTRRSVAAATEYIATCRVAPQLYEVVNDSGDTYTVDIQEPACTCPDFEYRADSDDRVADHGCKHVRRVRMERGEIDVDPLRETNLRLDPLLLEAIDR